MRRPCMKCGKMYETSAFYYPAGVSGLCEMCRFEDCHWSSSMALGVGIIIGFVTFCAILGIIVISGGTV